MELLKNRLSYCPLSEYAPAASTNPLACLVMMTPVFFTAFGSRARAWFTRFCTSTEARSTSRVTSKTTVIWLVPSLPLDEVMYFIPSTPLFACSSGILTADSMFSRLDSVEHFHVVADVVADLHQLLPRNGSFAFIHRDESKILAVDAGNVQEGNHRSLPLTPRHLHS